MVGKAPAAATYAAAADALLAVFVVCGSGTLDGAPAEPGDCLLLEPEPRIFRGTASLLVAELGSATYEPGGQAVTAQAGELKLGVTICYDLRFPALYRALALAGAEVMTIPAAFTRPTGAAHWEVLMRARAIETGSFVLAPAQGGRHEDGRGTYGHSIVVAPWGEVLAHLDHDEPGILLADLEDRKSVV